MSEAWYLERRAIAIDRRIAAPHPGPQIARDYVEPLGYDAHEFADLIGMDGDRFAAMLAGTASLDVDAAVRLGRSLGLPAERILRMQNRYDFAVARARDSGVPVPPIDTLASRPLAGPFACGHLARTTSAESGLSLFFVADDDLAVAGLERIHPIGFGDRLRVFDADDAPVWCGPVLANLDKRPIFAFVPPAVWERWFDTCARAEYVTTREPHPQRAWERATRAR